MAENIQAITHLIKNGKKQEAYNALIRVLKEEPRNEQAWLMMTLVVPEDKKKACFEKVLKINPQNIHARQALGLVSHNPKTKPVPSASVNQAKAEPSAQQEARLNAAVKRDDSLPQAQSPAQPVKKEPVRLKDTSNLKSELYVKGQKYWIQVTLFIGSIIVHGQIERSDGKRFQQIIQEGKDPTQIMQRVVKINCQTIDEVVLNGSRIQVTYRADNQIKVKSLYFESKAMAESAMKNLYLRLPTNFKMKQEQAGTCSAIAGPGLMLLLGVGGTVFCYFGAANIRLEGTGSFGSYRTRALYNLLNLLGPNGVLIIGGIVCLVLLFTLFSNIKNPPILTKFVKEA